MLKKKLSKLIVSIMAAVMLSGGMSGVGQAVFANTSTGVVDTQVRRVENVNAATGEQNVITNINDVTVSTLRVTGEVVLTKGIVDAINARTTPLTIEVQQGSVLILNDAVSLNGTRSGLKIVRGSGKEGAMLETRAQNIQGGNVNVSVIGVTFDNSGVNFPAFANDVSNNTIVTLDGNTLLNNGNLSYESGNNVYANNKLGSGSITTTHILNTEVTSPIISGSRTATISGTISGNVALNATGTARIVVTDLSDKVVKTSSNLTITNSSVQTLIDGLTLGTSYRAYIEVDVKDGNQNSYTRKSTSVEFKTSSFLSTVTGITNNSATVSINHGGLPTSSYNLTITVSGGTATINPTSIDVNTNSVSLTGLASGTNYTYEIKDVSGNVIDRGTFRTTSSTITGGGNTGGSVVSGDLTTNDINRADIKDVSASIPVGNTTLANSLRDGKDYKTNVEGVSVTYSNGKVELTGLVPEKDYKDLTITYTDKDGRTRTVKVPSFKTKVSETKLRQFIVDVYRYSLDRIADERGFAYWEDQLKNKKTSPDDFVKNLLNENEFLNKHTTTTAKIEGLYQVIVNRKSDSQGLSFWTNKYDDLVRRGYSDSMALRSIVDEMVNEPEFKNRVRDLGL